MSDDRNVRTVRDFTRIFKNQHDVDGAAHLFHPEFKHNFKMPLPPGWQGFAAVGRMMNGAFPDVAVTEEDLIAGGDKVVERSSCVATHRGDFMGLAPTNKPVRWTEIHIYRLKDGKLVEHWAEFSLFELVQQIREGR
jgi:predicted ester cyclase